MLCCVLMCCVVLCCSVLAAWSRVSRARHGTWPDLCIARHLRLRACAVILLSFHLSCYANVSSSSEAHGPTFVSGQVTGDGLSLVHEIQQTDLWSIP